MKTRDELTTRFQGRKFLCILVTLDKIYLGNAKQWLHKFIEEEAEKLYDGDLPEDFLVTDVAGLEHFVQLVVTTNASPGSLIAQKMGSTAASELDLMTFVSQVSPGNLEKLTYLRDASDVTHASLVEFFKN